MDTKALDAWLLHNWQLPVRRGLPLLRIDQQTALSSSMAVGPSCVLLPVLQRLEQGDPLHMLFLGTSVTEGSGIKNPLNVWPALLAHGIRKAWPKSTVTFTNAALGGTSAGYSAACIDSQLAGQRTDLVLIEYTADVRR